MFSHMTDLQVTGPVNMAGASRTPPRLAALAGLIGGTPLLSLRVRFRGLKLTIHAKAEHYNLTGSIKDRMALSILAGAYQSGALNPGDTIAEATSGNAGIALTALGRALGHPVRIFMPDWMSEERKRLLQSLGASLHLVSREEGGFIGAIAASEAYARENRDVFLPCQFSNQDNPAAHARGTARELLEQMSRLGLRPDAFVAGVGTGGTVMGAAQTLRQACPGIRVHPIEPMESPTLTTGYKTGHHRIQGISDDFIPALVRLDELDPVIAVSDGDAIRMAQRLARELGLAVGISSGANLIGAVLAASQTGADAHVATIFCDDNKKYLSTDLAGEEPHRDGHLTQEIELIDFQATPWR